MGKKTREPRKATATPARINSGGKWQDVCIRNISSRGMMIEAQSPPPRGHYLEVRRGEHVIIGRVVWSSGYRVGILSQDRLEVGAIVADAKVPRRIRPSGELAERRKQPRIDDRHQRSRLVGKTIEYGSVLALGAIGAFAIVDMATAALGQPLEQVRITLEAGKVVARR